MKKIALIAVFCLLIFSVLPTNVAWAEILFEMPAVFGTADFVWGGNDILSPPRIGEFIFPHATQQAPGTCEVGLWLAKSGDPTDNVILKLYREGIDAANPEIGELLAQASISASSLSPSVQKLNFHLDNCLDVDFDTWFILSRSNPGSQGEYVSQIVPLNIFGNTSFGYFNDNEWILDQGKELRLTLETGTPAPQKEPVIIVPGIMGSYLNRVSDGEEVWPNTDALIATDDGFILDLKLSSVSEEIININSTGIIERELLVFPFYEDLLDLFRNSGYTENQNLLIFHYDWRQDISSLSLELEETINNATNNSPTGKVNIVAHSMGGLITKEYLRQNQNNLSNINKIVLAGSPQLGAVKAFKLLNFGDNLSIPVLNNDRVKEISKNMPSVYELLPSNKYVELEGGYIRDLRNGQDEILNFEEISNFMLNDSYLPDHRNTYLLDKANQFHSNLDNLVLNGPEIHNIIGCSEKTLLGIEVKDKKKADIKLSDGDGTVPFQSARYGFSQNQINYYANKFNHFELVSDDESLSLIKFIITGENPGETPNISKINLDCILNSYLLFSTYSPVNLIVYDNQNNFVGLDENGDINIGIPNSDFIQISDNNFVVVPEGEYRAVIDAYATGSFDFQIRRFVNNELSESIIYSDVLIGDPNLNAELEFNGQFSNLLLNIDNDDNGSIDRVLNSDNPVTLESTVDDMNIIYSLGWMSKSARDYVIKQLEKAVKLDNKGEDISDILMGLIRKLDNYLRQGLITQDGYDIIKKDLELLLI